MKITLESTSKIIYLDGVPARIWEGRTDTGIPVQAFITRLAVHNDQDQAQFQKELQICREPSPAAQAWPLKLML